MSWCMFYRRRGQPSWSTYPHAALAPPGQTTRSTPALFWCVHAATFGVYVIEVVWLLMLCDKMHAVIDNPGRVITFWGVDAVFRELLGTHSAFPSAAHA